MASLRKGQKIHRLTIIRLAYKDNRYRKFYKVKCACGTSKVINGALLVSGNTKSCGCLSREVKRTRTLLPNNGGVVNHIILQYKRHARNRGIGWELTREVVDCLVREPCAYCGVIAGNLKKTKNCKDGFPHNGIDRLNPAIGYADGNVVPACGFCNRAKQSMTREEFMVWIEKVSAYQNAMARN